MQVICAIYGNTGFNSVNKPDTPALLQVMADSGKCEILYSGVLEVNTTYLPQIIIEKKWEEIASADYVILTDNVSNLKLFYCYSVGNITMLDDETARLELVIDAVNTLGGLTNCEVLQGIVERRCVGIAEDTYGKYALDEPFTPQNPLKIKMGELFGNTGARKYNLIETILEVEKNKSDVLTPVGTVQNQEVLLVPRVKKLSNLTDVGMTGEGLDLEFTMPISKIDVIGATSTPEEIAIMRQYGLENAIINSYQVPADYMTQITALKMKTYNKKITPAQAGINLNYFQTYNKKAIYGEFSKLVLYSNCSGNKAEFKPEDIADSSGYYELIIISDPRANGKPVCYFKSYKGAQMYKIGANGVAGLTWSNTPIVWTDKSGSNVDRLNFQTSQKLKNDRLNMTYNQRQMDTVVNTTIGAVGSLMKGDKIGAIGAIGGGIGDAITNEYERAKAQKIQELELNAESEIFNRSSYYTQPEVSFARDETIRDFLGNSFLLTQLQLSDTDLINYDTFLTQFGYNVGGEVYNNSMINNRPSFNFIKFSSISIKSNKPMWVRKQAEAELKTGVRLWHEAPNQTALLNSGNRGV